MKDRKPSDRVSPLGVVLGVMLCVSCAGSTDSEFAELLALELQGEAAVEDWGQFGRTQRHTYFNPSEATITPENVSSLQVDFSLANNGRIPPYVWDGRLFASSNWDDEVTGGTYLQLNIHDPQTGASVSSARIFGEGGGSSSAVAYGRVVVSGDNERCVGARSGTTLWEHGYGVPEPFVGKPVMAGPVRYRLVSSGLTGASTSRLSARDGATGQELWAATLPGSAHGTPAIANGVIFAGTGSGSIRALDALSGTPLWSVETALGAVDGIATLGGRAFAVTRGTPSVVAIDTRKKRLLWTQALPGAAFGFNEETVVAVDGLSVYLAWSTTLETFVWRLDAATGEVLDTASLGNVAGVSGIAMTSEILFVALGNRLLARRTSDLSSLASFDLGAPVRDPIIVGGKVYAVTGYRTVALSLP